MTYPNGRIPLSMLVHLGGEHYLPHGTASRWLWLVAAARDKYGVTLRITKGPNAYRWFEAQVDAKQEATAAGRPQDAAAPGFSTHGGVVDGQEVMAIDVANWADLADDEDLAWARFVALCRMAGLTVLFIPWERWHIVDQNDVWAVPAWATAAPIPESEEDEMKETYIWWLDAAGNQQNLIYAVGGNGGQEHWTSNDGGYNTNVARGHNLAGPSYKVSPAHAQNVLDMLAAQRAGKR